jgi:glycosyltransferase involved in cell wall biosynthesis
VWTSAEDVARARLANKHLVPHYYVQDDERAFKTPSGVAYAKREDIEESYERIENKFANSTWVQQMLQELGHESHRIGIGVDSLEFHPREKPTDRVRVMCHCRASTPRRGWHFLTEALNLAAGRCEFELVTFDEKPDKDTLAMPWRGHLGRVSPAELAQHMSAAHVFVEGSQFQGFGMTALEAMACGCGVVSTDNKGIHEYGTHGHDCLIVDQGDVEKAAEYIHGLVDSKGTRNKFGANARKTAEAFDWRIIALEWDRILRNWR